MSTYAGALRPSLPISSNSRPGHGGLHTALDVLLDVCEIVAFSYRLRTAGAGPGRSAAR
jgi:hypothetical protein